MDEKTREKLTEFKKEISSVSAALNKLNETKEREYAEKHRISEELNSLIKSATQIKEKKDSVDASIRELKNERDLLNNRVKSIINKIKNSLSHRKKEKTATRPISVIKKEINGLEYKLETEVISFSKEKQIMNKINLLKKELEEAEKNLSFREISRLRKESRSLKKEADSFHEKIQGIANESSELFNKLTQKSKEIQTVKKKKNEIHKNLVEIKKKIKKLNDELEVMLKEWSKIAGSQILDINTSAKKKIPKIEEKDVISELKKKKKLTTEDFLFIQRNLK